MCPGLTRNFFGGKSSEIALLHVLICWSSIPCVFCLYYTLLKVVGYYDLSVLSMLVMCFQKNFGCCNVYMRYIGGWGELYPNFVFFDFFLTLQSPLAHMRVTHILTSDSGHTTSVCSCPPSTMP